MKLLRWCSNRFRDLFFGPGNEHADLGRVISFLATFAMLASTVWNILLGLPIELDKAGVGFAAVLGACAAFIYAKDRAKAENTVAKAMAAETTPPEPAVAPAPKTAAKPKPKPSRSRR